MKIIKMPGNFTMFAVIITALLTMGLTSCTHTTQNQPATITQTEMASITENEVLEAQQAWSDGIVNIGKVYLNNGDHMAAATEHINNFYNYQEGTVLFKPTMVSQKQFRTNFQGALSYFVGGDENYPEDHGFAIKPWRAVRWENIGTKIIGNMAVAMGDYYFTPVHGEAEVKVEYSFAYTKDKAGKLKIILHDSHLPYAPAGEH
jgi:hypothetical protein